MHEKNNLRRFGANPPFAHQNREAAQFFWEIRTAFVGANRATLRLFAKALFLTIHPQWMYRPLREQVPTGTHFNRSVSDHFLSPPLRISTWGALFVRTGRFACSRKA
ncbi:hypothetical protein CVE34_25615 [Pseudomonas syringae pv. actinidiae]|nr:hypothetical protein [Pseudomonas syringae pv. actinidiae]NAS72887.1 hypothetical protein [Pseudomonas syringae pv. actinidiae]NAS77836.1 hypothetical protein [Pseudomonas syringae pv. actinidiae]NAS91618.1 hypothetical protein [Pseudomonas syringae pv. actinidiae]NAT01891.1 hypothetical protein [Pseudomonas syringae pv. actinidiae]